MDPVVLDRADLADLADRVAPAADLEGRVDLDLADLADLADPAVDRVDQATKISSKKANGRTSLRSSGMAALERGSGKQYVPGTAASCSGLPPATRV